MTELVQRSSMPSNLFPWSTHLPIPYSSPSMHLPAKPLHALAEENRQRQRIQEEELILRGTPNQKVVAQWLASTSDVSPRDKHAPPLGINGVAVNSMLAPTCGGPYNGQGAPNSNSMPYPGNMSFYASKTLPSTAQPVHGNRSQPASPNHSNANTESQGNTSRRRSSGGDNQIISYLQIPSSINGSKGSLAEFAAQITCLFWFESSFTLHRVEESKTTPTPTEPLVLEAIPSMGFRKWVTTMLSTTQVTQNVILLALMFIYRLKKLNPTVKGKSGSEFRLLTVALMLGNKFLDDNTYTNKTWAEVSGISVQEIHIMEVEFLSNMRYTLYVSEQEWALWQQQLSRFWEYFDKASRTPPVPELRSATANLNGPLSLPSPPASLHTSPPALNRASTILSHLHPLSMPPYLAPSIQSPVPKMPDIDLKPTARKRSYDDQSQEPPAKKIARPFGPSDTLPASSLPSSSTTPIASNSSSYVPRLPIPNLSISTNGHPHMFSGSYSAHLPPPTSRSMSMVYPSTPQNPGNLLTPTKSSGSFSTLPPMNDQYRRPSNNGSRTTSPTANSFPQNTQELHSPSGYPVLRNSPYRPLRGVNTLLVPPPSASLHNPSQNLGYNNMHYQPLGKPLSERKTGVVPYMAQDPYQQLPQTSHWPYLPQPTLLAPHFRA